MNAGERRERIEIQAPPATVTNLGTVTGSWSTVCLRWVAVKGLRGGESTPEGVPVAAGVFVFTMAKPTPVTVNQRILWNGRYFNIIAVDDSDPSEIKVTAVDGQQREAGA